MGFLGYKLEFVDYTLLVAGYIPVLDCRSLDLDHRWVDLYNRMDLEWLRVVFLCYMLAVRSCKLAVDECSLILVVVLQFRERAAMECEYSPVFVVHKLNRQSPFHLRYVPVQPQLYQPDER